MEAFAQEVNQICKHTVRRLKNAPFSFEYSDLYRLEMVSILLGGVAELEQQEPPSELAAPYEDFLELLKEYPDELRDYFTPQGTFEEAEHDVSVLIQGGDLESLFECDELGLAHITDLRVRAIEGERDKIDDEYYEEKLKDKS